MAKNKLTKFAEMATYKNVFEYTFQELQDNTFPLKGKWGKEYFENDNPIVLELGCGKGEYTVGLARVYPNKNFIGMDIKGARMWTGATDATVNKLENVAFVRTHIEMIAHFFDTQEISEIWITLSIQTFYEKQWLSRGLNIKYLKFICPKKIEWTEHDIEIEHDEYRSFGRNRI